MAINGKIAVDMVNAGDFDLVLMDMHMPIMDGFEATRLLRSQGSEIPVIALTADAMAQDERKCRDVGCSHFVSKPIKRETLFSAIRALLPDRPAAVPQPTVNVKSANPRSESMKSVEQTVATTTPMGGESPVEPIESNLPMDDQDFIDIANLFKRNLDKKVQMMKVALQTDDFQQLVELGHWLKGSGGSAGFDCLANLESCLKKWQSQKQTGGPGKN